MATNTKRSWKLQEFTAHHANVNCLALGHKSGRVLVTGGDDKKVNLWAIGKETCIMSLGGHTTPVECVKFCHTEDMVCAGSQAGILKLWDLEAAKLFRTLTSHKGGIKCIDFYPYGDILASGSLDTSIKMWDYRSKSCIFTYKGHQQTVNSIKFSPDGQWIASGGEEGSVKIWDIRNGRVLENLNEHSGAVTDVEFHPHEFLLATSSADRSINIWDLENFHIVSKSEKESSVVRCLHFSSQGEEEECQCLFGGCADTLKVYGWEPARIFDTVTVSWGKVQDMATAQDQLIGASFFMTQVSICVVDIKKISPFVAPASHTSQSSPFSHGQSIRKSFNKQKPKEVKRKKEVETINEKYDAESEDEASNPFIPNVNDYEAVFKPQRSLNRSPPLHPFSEPTSEEDLSASSLTPNLSKKRANFTYADETTFEVVTATQSVSLPEHRIPSPVAPAPKPVKYQSQIHVSNSKSASNSQQSSGYSSLKSSSSRETLRRANSCKNNASTSTDFEPTPKPAENHINRSESSIPEITSRLPKPPPAYKRTISNKYEDPPVPDATPVPYANNATTSENHDNDIIPASCDSPVDLQLTDFLPSSYRNGLHSNQSHSNLSENEIMSSLTRNHEMVLTILKIRQRNLQIVYSLWHNQDLKCAIEGAVSMNDQAVLVDVLSAINKRPSLWNLDICVVLLPAIHNLLHSKYEMYMTVCCDSLKLILRNFASVIRTNVQWSSPTIGTDISKEERYAKCVKCYESLIAIRTFLLKRQTMQGKLGQSFREVQTLLYSIEK